MAKDPRKTTHVTDRQIVDERSVNDTTGKHILRSRPPVRDLARTGLFLKALKDPPPQLPPDDAPATRDATRELRDLVEPDYRHFVEHCPFPVIQLDRDGRIEWANEPFAEFARKPLAELAGERIDSTRLGIVYPGVLDDLTACRQQTQPPTLRQTLLYQLQDGREVRRGCWIVPEAGASGVVERFYCYLLPIQD